MLHPTSFFQLNLINVQLQFHNQQHVIYRVKVALSSSTMETTEMKDNVARPAAYI